MSDLTRRRALAGMVGGVAGLAGCDAGMNLGSGGRTHGSFLGEGPPSLEAGGTWLNVDSPLTIRGLAGNVVWLEFSFLH